MSVERLEKSRAVFQNPAPKLSSDSPSSNFMDILSSQLNKMMERLQSVPGMPPGVYFVSPPQTLASLNVEIS